MLSLSGTVVDVKTNSFPAEDGSRVEYQDVYLLDDGELHLLRLTRDNIDDYAKGDTIADLSVTAKPGKVFNAPGVVFKPVRPVE